MNQKLPVFKIIIATTWLFFERKWILLTFISFFYFFSLLIHLTQAAVSTHFGISFNIFYFSLLQIILAFSVHRIVLLPVRPWDEWYTYTVDKNFFIFLKKVILIFLSASVPIILFYFYRQIDYSVIKTETAAIESPFQLLFFFLLIIFGLYIATRLSITLPAAATGDDKKLSVAHHETSGNGLRLFLLIIVLPLTIRFLLHKITTPSLLLQLMMVFTELFVITLAIMFLSYAYMSLEKKDNYQT